MFTWGIYEYVHSIAPVNGRFENGHFVCPDIETLKKYRLIVTTLQTARTLKLKGFKKDYFTHIFIDEVAQVK